MNRTAAELDALTGRSQVNACNGQRYRNRRSGSQTRCLMAASRQAKRTVRVVLVLWLPLLSMLAIVVSVVGSSDWRAQHRLGTRHGEFKEHRLCDNRENREPGRQRADGTLVPALRHPAGTRHGENHPSPEQPGKAPDVAVTSILLRIEVDTQGRQRSGR
jgi:hypothetical protein